MGRNFNNLLMKLLLLPEYQLINNAPFFAETV